MKRKWLMVPMVTGLLAVGLTGATALAHNNDGEGESLRETVAGKVAAILGIEDEQTVKNALQQATREVQDDKLDHRLDHMVENEVLSQEQADEYYSWYQDRPEGPNFHRIGRHLDRMVEAGVLTQDQADEYTAWYESRPEGPNLLNRGHERPGFEGGDGRPQANFGQRGYRGQDSPGFGQRPERGDGSESRQLPNGREFPGGGELRSRFNQRFGGQEFPGQGGEVPSEAPSEAPAGIPEGNGTSF